jgi:hypothetical protein
MLQAALSKDFLMKKESKVTFSNMACVFPKNVNRLLEHQRC